MILSYTFQTSSTTWRPPQFGNRQVSALSCLIIIQINKPSISGINESNICEILVQQVRESAEFLDINLTKGLGDRVTLTSLFLQMSLRIIGPSHPTAWVRHPIEAYLNQLEDETRLLEPEESSTQ